METKLTDDQLALAVQCALAPELHFNQEKSGRRYLLRCIICGRLEWQHDMAGRPAYARYLVSIGPDAESVLVHESGFKKYA